MVMLARNTERNVTVFAKGATSVIWAASGDPMGDDVQLVPDDLAADVDFIKTVQRGVLVVEGDHSSMIGADHAADFVAQRQAQHAATMSTLDRRQDRDIIRQDCIGPNLSGRGGLCGGDVLVRSAQTGDTPPLCPRHESLTSQFYLVATGSVGEGGDGTAPGQVSKVWKRTEITAPQRAVSTT